MHIEQDVVDFEMGDTDAKSGPDSIVGIGYKRDLFTAFCFSLSGEKLLEWNEIPLFIWKLWANKRNVG